MYQGTFADTLIPLEAFKGLVIKYRGGVGWKKRGGGSLFSCM